MSLTSGFYPSRDGDRKYSAEQFGALFDGIITDGIMGSQKDKQLFVEAGGGRTLLIHPGRAWFNHTWVNNTTNYSITVSASESLLDRIDAVVLKIDRNTSVRRASFLIVKGTPASKPVKPTVTDTTVVTQTVIAYVSVKAGATSITQGDIEWPATTKFCTGPMKTMDVEQLMAQWKAKMQECKDSWDSTLTGFKNDWNTRFINLNLEYSNVTLDSSGLPIGKFPRLYEIWRSNFDTLWTNWRDNFNTLWTENNTRFNTLYTHWDDYLEALYNTWDESHRSMHTYWDNTFESFMFNSNQTFEAFMSRIDVAFDAFEAQKQQEIDDMLANLGNEFSIFWTNFKALMNDYLTGQETIWESWFSHIRNQLDEDAAGHLQSQIDALTYIYVYDNELIFPGTAASVGGHELILSNPAITTPIPAFGVNPDTGHLNYASNQTFNVDDTSGHIQWDFT